MTKNAPKYERIKNYLIQGIASRSFTDLVPSENQLAEKFGVSRMTARRALVDLEHDGSVERIPGKGTFIRKAKHYTRGFFRVRPFKKWAEDLNVTLSTRVLTSQITDPPPEIAQTLRYDGEVIHLRIMNYFDDLAVRFAVRYLRADQCAGILWEDLENHSVQDLLTNKYQLPLTRISQSMTAIGLSAATARLFGETEGYPAFYVQRLAYSYESPLTYVEYYMRGEMAFEDNFTPELDHLDPTAAGID
jgi:GntR family transcriptional regulator